jgi:hypothetical protein
MTAFFPELHPHTDESAKNGSVTAARIRIRPVVGHFRFVPSTSRSATTNSRSFHRFVLGLGTDLRVHGPPLSEEFVYLSLAAEIEPEGRRFVGTLESAGCSLMAV